MHTMGGFGTLVIVVAALWATKQPSLGTALLVPHGDGPRKGGLNKACPSYLVG